MRVGKKLKMYKCSNDVKQMRVRQTTKSKYVKYTNKGKCIRQGGTLVEIRENVVGRKKGKGSKRRRGKGGSEERMVGGGE